MSEQSKNPEQSIIEACSEALALFAEQGLHKGDEQTRIRKLRDIGATAEELSVQGGLEKVFEAVDAAAEKNFVSQDEANNIVRGAVIQWFVRAIDGLDFISEGKDNMIVRIEEAHDGEDAELVERVKNVCIIRYFGE